MVLNEKCAASMCWENVFSEKTSMAAEKSYGAVITFQAEYISQN